MFGEMCRRLNTVTPHWKLWLDLSASKGVSIETSQGGTNVPSPGLLFVTVDLRVVCLISGRYSDGVPNKHPSSAPFSRHHVGLIMQHLSPASLFKLVIRKKQIVWWFHFQVPLTWGKQDKTKHIVVFWFKALHEFISLKNIVFFRFNLRHKRRRRKECDPAQRTPRAPVCCQVWTESPSWSAWRPSLPRTWSEGLNEQYGHTSRGSTTHKTILTENNRKKGVDSSFIISVRMRSKSKALWEEKVYRPFICLNRQTDNKILNYPKHHRSSFLFDHILYNNVSLVKTLIPASMCSSPNNFPKGINKLNSIMLASQMH